MLCMIPFLYKHVFEKNMPYAYTSLLFSSPFVFHLSSPDISFFHLLCIMLFTLVPIFYHLAQTSCPLPRHNDAQTISKNI